LRKTFKLINKKISGASFETKRAVLKLLVEKVILEKKKATIKIRIPSPSQGRDVFASQTSLGVEHKTLACISLEVSLTSGGVEFV